MSITMTDKSGTIREPQEFAKARKIVIARIVKTTFPPDDIELFMEFTTIIQALEIAEAIARSHHAKAESQ